MIMEVKKIKKSLKKLDIILESGKVTVYDVNRKDFEDLKVMAEYKDFTTQAHNGKYMEWVRYGGVTFIKEQ